MVSISGCVSSVSPRVGLLHLGCLSERHRDQGLALLGQVGTILRSERYSYDIDPGCGLVAVGIAGTTLRNVVV